jgi:SAM-dependent methyltransferase
MRCRICGADTQAVFAAREMMLGLRTEHSYARCKECGSIQIGSVPDDLHRYYDHETYYSLQHRTGTDHRSWLRAWIGNRLDRAYIFSEGGFVGRLARARSNPVAERLKSFLGDSPVQSWDAKILDVGCGSGDFVRELAMHGFRCAEGIDPFMPQDAVRAERPARLRRAGLDDISSETFDVILLTHVIEHVEDPPSAMKSIALLAGARGICRIEVPVVDSEACRIYGEDWVELDAPRHLTIPTRRAVAHLATQSGLEIYRSEPAGSGFEFWGSEMYRRGYTLFDHENGHYRQPDEVFSEIELRDFQRRAESAIKRGESGRERFYLRRAAR